MRNRRITLLVSVAILLTLFVPLQLFGAGVEGPVMSTEKPKISFMFIDAGRTKWTKDTYIIKEWAKQMGDADLELMPIPDDIGTKARTLIASRSVPDLMRLRKEGLGIIKEYGPKGVFFPVDTKFDMVPSINRYRQQYPEYDKVMKALDGHQYGYSMLYPTSSVYYAFMFSPAVKDFGVDPENDIDTYEDLYQALKTVKQADPENYPWVSRDLRGGANIGLGGIEEMVGSGKSVYFKPGTEKYAFGPIEDNFKFLVGYMANAYQDGILHPDYFTMTEEPWRELRSTGKAYFTADGASQATMSTTDDSDPSKFWIPIMAPKLNGVQYWSTTKLQSVFGYPWVISAESKYIDNLVRFINYLYSQEGAEFQYFGKVGEVSERMPDGLLRYIIPEGKSPPNVWKGEETIHTLGLMSWRITGVYAPDFYMNNPHRVKQEGTDPTSIQYNARYANMFWGANAVKPSDPTLTFTDEESDRVKQLKTAIDTVAAEATVQFVLGQKPLSEWNAYVAQIKNMGVDELIQIHQTAYARYIK